MAATVEVLCPYCGAEQPSPDTGSDLWLPPQVKANEGRRVCVSCEETFMLHAQSSARIDVAS